MDVTPYLSLEPSPQTLRRLAAERSNHPRFHVREAGTFRPVTWHDLITDVRHLTNALINLGLAPNDRAAIFSENRLPWLIAAYTIQSAGAAMIPIYPASTADQAAYVLNHARAHTVFVGSRALLDRLLQSAETLTHLQHVVLFDANLRDHAAPLNNPARQSTRQVHTYNDLLTLGRATPERARHYDTRVDALTLDDIGLILYTSGTSGHPKGVPLSYRNTAVNGRDWLINNATLIAPENGERAVDLLWLPMSHIFGFGQAGLGNVLGFETYLCEPAETLSLLQELRPHIFMSVPSTWDKLATLSAGDPERLRELTGGRLQFCLSGGAGLRKDVKDTFLAAGLLIIEGYGLTEASPTLTMNRPDRYRFDSVGLPFPSVELRLADDGEIQARGDSIFSGYLDDATATANAFTDDGWLKTGDLGRFTDDGFLQIIGRKKEILVTAGGKNVPPANIEAHFAGDPFIAHTMVHGDGKKYLVAGFWVDPSTVDRLLAGTPTLTHAAAQTIIREHIAARVEAVNATLARYETLKHHAVFFEPLTVDGGLLTSTLKLRRGPITAVYGTALDALYDNAATA